MTNLVLIVLIGLAAGWLAGKVIKGSSFGLLGNLIIGVAGAIIGGYIFEFLGIPTPGMLGVLVSAILGSVVLLYVIQTIKKQL
jgi:uncharacterized membrane protein YeaQ/YmgE (transglycosylase-associated protein family)